MLLYILGTTIIYKKRDKILKSINYDKESNNRASYWFNGLKNKIIKAKKYDLKEIYNNISDKDSINNRVNYYNKLTNNSKLSNGIRNKNLSKFNKKSTYDIDLYEYSRFFNKNNIIKTCFGDITYIPEEPSIVKSRPISDNNQNSIVMNLNKIRHFVFVNDTIEFNKKKDILIWRGGLYQDHRIKFVKKWFNNSKCDLGAVGCNSELVKYSKKKMTIKEQLEYKFILSIEGNDVATNTKWIMSSNSLCFMPMPKYETWFMEGKLIPNYHFVLINEDYSNVEELIDYYSKNTDEAKKIINNANQYCKQFLNKEKEDLISLMVLDKYFTLTE